MTNRFMISVAAAALIAGTGFAYAQGTMGREAPAAGAPAAQSAPSSEHTGPSAAPAGREATKPMAPSSGMKSTQSDQKMQPGAKGEKSAQDNMKGEKAEKSKSMSSESEKGQGGKDMKAEGREGRDGNMKAEGREGRDGNMKAEGREGRESSQTTGQAGAGAKLSGEQRTRITTVIRNEHVQPLTHVNFSISVGTRVPRDVSFHRLPTEIVTIYPEWRGYEYVLVNDQILVIDPRTFEIVAVLDA